MNANTHCLVQTRRLLSRLDHDQYTRRRGEWSPIGAQIRHVIEHYQCFLEGLPLQAVDYDGRRRDPRIEASIERAQDVIVDLLERWKDLSRVSDDHPLRVQMRKAVDDPEACWTDSSVGRELQFLVSHSVHHFALIKLLLANEAVELDPDFGTAPSTVANARLNG